MSFFPPKAPRRFPASKATNTRRQTGETPAADAEWTEMEAVEATEAAGSQPGSVLKAALKIQNDTDQTFWVRAVSNVKLSKWGIR